MPLDPHIPPARISYILQDSQASLLVANNQNLSLAGELARARIELLNIDALDSSLPTENLDLAIPPDTPSWILYTSGSTGKPKGVVQSHRNVLHFVMNYANGYYICSADRLSLLFSYSVNGAAHEIFSALLNGASLHILDVREEGLDRLAPWLVEPKVTIYCSVPTLFRHFTEALRGTERFPSLRVIKLIGEPVYKRDVDLYKGHFSETCVFINRLGSSETGTIRWYFIDKKTEIDDHLVPVGYAVEDNEILLLDETGTEVGFDATGEIAVRSHYLSPGYWQRPDLTEAAFLPDPNGGSECIYLTGDLGRMRPDGCLVHLGRKDFQVKVRGYRIEVVEIEMALLQLDTIKEAVVVAREDESGEQRLVAYLILATASLPAGRALRRQLAKTLPSYMIPSVFVTMQTFPMAPNGKLDRRALPAPHQEPLESRNDFVAPRTPMETLLAETWQQVLGLERVGVRDNFFDLGGQSLLSVKVISKLERQTGVRISPAEMVVQNLGQLAADYQDWVDDHPRSEATGSIRKLFHRAWTALVAGEAVNHGTFLLRPAWKATVWHLS